MTAENSIGIPTATFAAEYHTGRAISTAAAAATTTFTDKIQKQGDSKL